MVFLVLSSHPCDVFSFCSFYFHPRRRPPSCVYSKQTSDVNCTTSCGLEHISWGEVTLQHIKKKQLKNSKGKHLAFCSVNLLFWFTVTAVVALFWATAAAVFSEKAVKTHSELPGQQQTADRQMMMVIMLLCNGWICK